MAAQKNGKIAVKADPGYALFTSGGRELMKDRAYLEIKRFLQNGDLSPGSFLAERNLAEQLGMSKTPIRAALERLEMEGYVTISPQQGIIVRDLTVHEIADQYEIRIALETYVARTMAGRLTPEQVDRLHANLQAQDALRDGRDVSGGVTLDAEFHILLCEFLGNHEILRVMSQLRERIHRVITKVCHINPGRIETSYLEHAAIANAIIAGEGPQAARLIEAHLEVGKQSLLSPRRG